MGNVRDHVAKGLARWYPDIGRHRLGNAILTKVQCCSSGLSAERVTPTSLPRSIGIACGALKAMAGFSEKISFIRTEVVF